MITIEFADALQSMVAIDTAITALMVPAFIERSHLTRREADHALIVLRALRSQLLQARADFIQHQLKGN